MSLNFNGNYIGGVPSGGGGGTPYILPIASENTLGGVKIDGETINIDEQGVISTPIDNSFSFSSLNPIQNSILTKALFYKDGDEIDLTWFCTGAYLTTSRTEVDIFAITGEKSFENINNITVSKLEVQFRIPAGGYLLDAYTDVVSAGERVTAEKATKNTFLTVIKFRNELTNGVNNTPLSCMIKSATFVLS